MKNLIFKAILISLFVTVKVNAYEVTLQPGPVDGYDSLVYGGYPDYTYGDSTTLYTINTDGSGLGQPLIKFDLSAYTGLTVSSATLKLYYWHGISDDGQPKEVYANRILESWDEDTVSWNNGRPSFTSDGRSTQSVGSGDFGWVEWDVADMINYWLAGTYDNYGFMLTMEYYFRNSKEFYSSDYTDDPSLRPQLILDINDSAIPEPLSIIMIGLGIVGLIKKRSIR